MRLTAQIQARLAFERPSLGASAAVLGERVARSLNTSPSILEPLTFRHWYSAMDAVPVQRTLSALDDAKAHGSRSRIQQCEATASRALHEALHAEFVAHSRSERRRLVKHRRRQLDRSTKGHSTARRTRAAALDLHRVEAAVLRRLLAHGRLDLRRVGIRLIESRRSAVSDLRSRLDAALLQHRERYTTALRRLHRVGSAFWQDAACRVLSDWCAATPTVEFRPVLDPDDRRLTGKWLPPPREDPEVWDKLVYSARRAEKSAQTYYRQFQCHVEDIAILQLADERADWRSHDLTVDGRPIDVKNVRGGAFGGYVVRDEPKRTTAGESVAICGVVSEDEGDKTQTVIGEATGDGLRSLQPMVENLAETLSLPLKWAGMTQWQRGLGAWLMEFVPEHYDGRDNEALVGLVRRAGRLTAWLGPVPAWARGLEAFWGSSSIVRSEGDHAENVVRALAGWSGSRMTSRPALFMFVLLFLLSEVRQGRWRPRKTREEILDVLYATGSTDSAEAYRHPLGLHDPLGTVRAVVLALDELAARNKSVLEEVESLHLRGVGVLRGRLRNKPWFTLLAYCGGCGKSPIWAGDLRALWDRDRKGTRQRRVPSQSPQTGADGEGDGCGLCHTCRHLVLR